MTYRKPKIQPPTWFSMGMIVIIGALGYLVVALHFDRIQIPPVEQQQDDTAPIVPKDSTLFMNSPIKLKKGQK